MTFAATWTLPVKLGAWWPLWCLDLCFFRFLCFFAGFGRLVSQPALSAKTAIASSPESEARRRQPSLVTLTFTGCVPTPCERSTDSLRSTVIFDVSITVMRSSLATATYARSLFGSIVIASGCERCAPTVMSFSFVPLARSITETVPSDSFETRPLPLRVIAAP